MFEYHRVLYAARLSTTVETHVTLRQVVEPGLAGGLSPETRTVDGLALLIVNYKLTRIADAAAGTNDPLFPLSFLILANGCATYDPVCGWRPLPVHLGRSYQFEEPFIYQTLDDLGDISFSDSGFPRRHIVPFADYPFSVIGQVTIAPKDVVHAFLCHRYLTDRNCW
jgi:hypothetical protein